MKLKLVDLFAGTGGFSIAFEATTRVQCVFANDVDKQAKVIYDQNHLNVKLTLADLITLDESTIPQMDILTGGFPCQPFSIAGKRKGFDDDRSTVVWKLLRVIDCHQPKCVVLENVKGILPHVDRIIERLDSIGYNVHYNLINTCTLTSIPHNRERVFFVCFRKDLNISDFEWPKPHDDEPVQSLDCFLERDPLPKFYYSSSSVIWDKLANSVIDSTIVYQYRRTHVRANKSGVCPTLTANMGTGGHNVPIILDTRGIRKLTPRECFNLQGFPPTYSLNGLSNSALYRLAGNAVTVSVVERIAHRIVRILDGLDK